MDKIKKKKNSKQHTLIKKWHETVVGLSCVTNSKVIRFCNKTNIYDLLLSLTRRKKRSCQKLKLKINFYST